MARQASKKIMSIAGEKKNTYMLVWLFSRPDLLIRAARHYEGAEQILRRRAVFTAKQVRLFLVSTCHLLSTLKLWTFLIMTHLKTKLTKPM